jgi:hypothetical protein
VHNARLWKGTPHGLVEIVGLLRMWHVREIVWILGSIRGCEAGDEIDAVQLAVVTVALHATKPN